MKRTLILLVLLAGATAAMGQAGYGNQDLNLRGLKGVRLVVMFGRVGAIEENDRPEILKLVEADAIAKFQKARIPLFRSGNELEEAGSPQLMVFITCDKPNGFVYPIVTNVTLLQRVRLSRDPSIEADLATWEQRGIGEPLSVEAIRRQVAEEIDQFIRDYQAVNSTNARR